MWFLFKATRLHGQSTVKHSGRDLYVGSTVGLIQAINLRFWQVPPPGSARMAPAEPPASSRPMRRLCCFIKTRQAGRVSRPGQSPGLHTGAGRGNHPIDRPNRPAGCSFAHFDAGSRLAGDRSQQPARSGYPGQREFLEQLKRLGEQNPTGHVFQDRIRLPDRAREQVRKACRDIPRMLKPSGTSKKSGWRCCPGGCYTIDGYQGGFRTGAGLSWMQAA